MNINERERYETEVWLHAETQAVETTVWVIVLLVAGVLMFLLAACSASSNRRPQSIAAAAVVGNCTTMSGTNRFGKSITYTNCPVDHSYVQIEQTPGLWKGKLCYSGTVLGSTNLVDWYEIGPIDYFHPITRQKQAREFYRLQPRI